MELPWAQRGWRERAERWIRAELGPLVERAAVGLLADEAEPAWLQFLRDPLEAEVDPQGAQALQPRQQRRQRAFQPAHINHFFRTFHIAA